MKNVKSFMPLPRILQERNFFLSGLKTTNRKKDGLLTSVSTLKKTRFPISNFNGNWCSPEGNTKYNSPGGYCYGIAAYTQWYFAEMRDSLGSLHDYPGYDGRHIVTVHGFLGQLHFRDSQEQ